MAAQGLDDYGNEAIYNVRASVGLSESLNTAEGDPAGLNIVFRSPRGPSLHTNRAIRAFHAAVERLGNPELTALARQLRLLKGKMKRHDVLLKRPTPKAAHNSRGKRWSRN